MWYIDGTFKLCKKPFTQLLTIDAFVHSGDCAKQVPLVFVLMSSCKKRDYRTIFRSVLTLMLCNPSVRQLKLDLSMPYGQQLLTSCPTYNCLDVPSTGPKQCGVKSRNLVTGHSIFRITIYVNFCVACCLCPTYQNMKLQVPSSISNRNQQQPE